MRTFFTVVGDFRAGGSLPSLSVPEGWLDYTGTVDVAGPGGVAKGELAITLSCE